MRTITLAQFFDAMEKNGLPKHQGNYLIYSNDDNEVPVAGCAFGQAALNLHVRPDRLHEAVVSSAPAVFVNIVGDNDSTDMSIPEIARKYRDIAKSSDMLDLEIDVREF